MTAVLDHSMVTEREPRAIGDILGPIIEPIIQRYTQETGASRVDLFSRRKEAAAARARLWLRCRDAGLRYQWIADYFGFERSSVRTAILNAKKRAA